MVRAWVYRSSRRDSDRKPLIKVKDTRLMIRISSDELEAIKKEAALREQSLSDFVRETCLCEAFVGEVLRSQSEPVGRFLAEACEV